VKRRRFIELSAVSAGALHGGPSILLGSYGKCIRLFEKSGYKGLYSLEQWGEKSVEYD